DTLSLDGEYAAFGRVTDGMDVLDKLAETPNSGPNGAVAEKDKPIIKSITIDVDDELPEPEKL
ncbi:MAG: peptidylprolyl isomerase, partial [Gracilibacteraceae bacterium]|nr:peptidylprolyl isomerase [Gracilibacteraceae bacterium]